jgi:hypothetical protein
MDLNGLALAIESEYLTAPAVGWARPNNSLMVVVFPAPLGPR